MKRWHWLLPGLGVKRWLLLVATGTVAVVTGALYLLTLAWPRLVSQLWGENARGEVMAATFLLLFGALLLAWGIRRGNHALRMTYLRREQPDLAGYLRQRYRAERGPRLVVIGGGTGLATLLRGLKAYSSNLTAIVTVSDEGGSSGRLRRDLGILPPGDIRNCLLALADTEPVMERLFQHRFQHGSELAGHSFGNLFIAAMTEMSGDFEQAVHLFSQVLAVRGRVLPATLTDVRIKAYFADGSVLIGEAALAKSNRPVQKIELDPPAPPLLPAALKAIAEAEAVIIGPGSLYTSIIPNLLIGGMVDALRQTSAKVIYVCNVMTQPGETRGYGAIDHLQALLRVTGQGVIDAMLMNGEIVTQQRLEIYTERGAHPVLADRQGVLALGVQPVVASLANQEGLVRHDPERLAQALLLKMMNGKEGLGWSGQERWDHIGGTVA